MPSILIVEDEDAIREVECLYLQKAGFSVLEATDGAQALQLWREHKPDIISLDLNLPLFDGREVCKTIRKEDTTVPIIMVTAKVEEVDEVAGLQIGADDYLKKPFSPSILVARVQTLLRRVSPSTELRFGELTIDPESYTVTVQGKKQQLTTLPFKILHLLASNPEKVFSRDEILDRVYGEDAVNVFDRVIDAHIKAIRQILGDAATHIQTVIGSGYKFSV